MRTGVAWLGIALTGWTIAGCGKGSPQPRRQEAEQDAPGPVVDATPGPDARWRHQMGIGFIADILPLLERDCPKDAPPLDWDTRVGKLVTEWGDWICRAPIRPGLLRHLRANFTFGPQRVVSFEVGYDWDFVLEPRPPECDLLDEEVLEYLSKVITNDDGVRLTAEDLDRVRRMRNRDEHAVELSTGWLNINRSRCRYSISGYFADGDLYEPFKGFRDAGSVP